MCQFSDKNEYQTDPLCSLCQLNWPGHRIHDSHSTQMNGHKVQVNAIMDYQLQKKKVRISLHPSIKKRINEITETYKNFKQEIQPNGENELLADFEFSQNYIDRYKINDDCSDSWIDQSDALSICDSQFTDFSHISKKRYRKKRQDINIVTDFSKYTPERTFYVCSQIGLDKMYASMGQQLVESKLSEYQNEMSEEEMKILHEVEQIISGEPVEEQNEKPVEIKGTKDDKIGQVMALLEKLKNKKKPIQQQVDQQDVPEEQRQIRIIKGDSFKSILDMRQKVMDSMFDIKITNVYQLTTSFSEETKKHQIDQFKYFIQQSWSPFNIPTEAYFIKYINDNKPIYGKQKPKPGDQFKMRDFVIVKFKGDFMKYVQIVMDQYDKHMIPLNYDGCYISYEKIQQRGSSEVFSQRQTSSILKE